MGRWVSTLIATAPWYLAEAAVIAAVLLASWLLIRRARRRRESNRQRFGEGMNHRWRRHLGDEVAELEREGIPIWRPDQEDEKKTPRP